MNGAYTPPEISEHAVFHRWYWMSAREAREAIPPAYTEWIGTQLRAALEVAA